MRFKSENKSSQMPELNLVPMMDVVMAILIFFIFVSMTLTNQKSLNITLPSSEGGTDIKTPEPLMVVLDLKGEILITNQPISEQELEKQIKSYLEKNPQGAVVLKADKKVSYEELAKLLGKMQKVGGEQVSLAIESN